MAFEQPPSLGDVDEVRKGSRNDGETALALSFDHRAFDGAYAGAFIGRVRDILETRDWSQEL